MSKQKKADFMLLLVTLFWGASYYMIDISLRDLQPMMLNAVRFLVAFALMGAVFFNKIKSVSKETLKYACIAGVAMSGAYLCCTLGVLHTSLSNAGFLGGLSVIFTPILGLIFKKQIPTGKFAVVAILCIVGVGLLTLNGGFKPAAGDLLCICGSLSFSCNLLITETAVKNKSVDPFQMAIYELGAVAVLMSIGALIFEKPSLFFLSQLGRCDISQQLDLLSEAGHETNQAIISKVAGLTAGLDRLVDLNSDEQAALRQFAGNVELAGLG